MQACYCKSNESEFLTWFVQLIAPVLIGAKPAEILSFPSDEKQKVKLESIKSSIKCSKLLFKEFSYCSKCTKLFIYNPRAINETLLDKRNQKFLLQLGYPAEYGLNAYIDTLMSKMLTGIIPDEIGVFLGYPLKDVIGFIGHKSLKLTKVKGWRVYGDPTLSDRKYKDFMEARESIKQLLTHTSPSSILAIV